MPPKKWKLDIELTRHFYEISENHQRIQRLNEIHQRHNENQANLLGDHEPAELGNAAFPPLNGVVREDRNGHMNECCNVEFVLSINLIPPVPAQVVPTGTRTWQQVVKGESSSASGKLYSSSNPSEQQISCTSANAEDPSSNAAAAVNYLDAGQVSATIESSSTSTTMRISRLEPYSVYNLWQPNPSFPLTLHELCRDNPPLKHAIEQSENCKAIPVPPQQVPPITKTWLEIVKGESSASGKSEPSEQKITSTSSNAEEPSQDPASANAVEPSKDPASTNAVDPSKDPASTNAAVKSYLDVGQASATTESASTSTTMSGQEPHSKHNLSNPNPENPPEQQIINTSSKADEQSEDPASTNAADAAVDSDLESASTSSYRDASDSELDVQTSNAKLLPPSIKEEILNRSPARDSSFQQSEDLQRGNLSNCPTLALVFFCHLLILLTLKVYGVE